MAPLLTMENLTFVSLFESEKDRLKTLLQGCVLPKDAQKLQTIVAQYMTQLFDGEGELRMNLTQSEDYILQAAISLLNAQQQMAANISDSISSSMKNATETTRANATSNIGLAAMSGPAAMPTSLMTCKVSAPSAIGGSAIGSIGGGLLFGTWGAVFGAIAGTALVLYISATTTEKPTNTEKPNCPKIIAPKETPINADQYISTIRNICQSLDSLIETFRAQIRRVVQKYESQEAPALEKEYKVLLEGLQSLIGYKRAHSSDEPKYLGKLQTRIEDVVEVLDNYNLTVIDYSSDNAHMFEELTSPNVTEPQMIAPAIIKDGNVILKGKVFVRE